MSDFNTLWLIGFGVIILMLCVITINFDTPDENDE